MTVKLFKFLALLNILNDANGNLQPFKNSNFQNPL